MTATRPTRLVLAVLAASLLLAGCRSRSAGNARSARSPNDIGVPECDEYLSKYGRCVANKIPAEQRKAYEDSLARMRAAWKTMAADPGARPGLGQSCTLALETARSSMQSHACEW